MATSAKIWRCEECPEKKVIVFFTEDELLEHKKEKVRNGEGHMACHICKIEHRTAEALDKHYQQVHPAKQDLNCPGCRKDFTRIGALMDHIEKGKCEGIQNDDVIGRRVEKTEFITKLQALDAEHEQRIGRKIQFGPGKINPNFGRYMGLIPERDSIPRSFTLEQEGANLDKETDFPRTAVQAFRHGDSKQPDLLTEENLGDLNRQTKNAWGQKKDLFPNAPPAIQPSEAQLNALQESAKTKGDVEDEVDPDSRKFHTARYYNQFTKKFKCPHKTCGKSFPTANGLVGHLKSPAHVHHKFQCPSCLRFFNSATALTQHAESQSTRCRVRDSTEYRQFIDQLTAGITDVQGRHNDNTVRYVVPENAAEPFLRGTAKEMLKTNAQKAHDAAFQQALKMKQDYWKDKTPDW